MGGSSQNTQGQAKIWLEYKGPQVLDACDPGMPSTHSAVNVEAWGGFFEPGSDYTGLIQARVAVSPHDVLEYATESPNNWVNIPSNGQLKLPLRKGNHIIYFRQKASSYAPMPVSERRVIRVSLLQTCSDCRGAPGGIAINSQRTIFGAPPAGVRSEGDATCNRKGCCRTDFDTLENSKLRSAKNTLGLTASDVTEQFSHTEIDQCRVRVRAPGAETYTWENCSTKFAGTGDNKYCYTVPNRISDPVCEGKPVYICQWDISDKWGGTTENNTEYYRVVNNPRAIFEVQYNGYGCD